MSQPVRIGTVSDVWKQVSAGGYHTLAIKADGSLWAWGYNGSGALGTPTTEICRVDSLDKPCSKAPIRVGTDNDWVVVDTGSEHSLAVRSDGNIYAWGYNLDGQVGNGTTTPVYSPALVENIQSGDIWPPRVIVTNPASGATDVLLNVTISATFNEAVDCSTVNGTMFTLAIGSTPVSGTVSCGGTIASFKPTANLALDTTYTATVKAGVKDLAGLAMTTDKTWNFKTGRLPSAPVNVSVSQGSNPYYFTLMVSWTDTADNETDFFVQRSTGTTCSNASWTTTLWGGPAISGVGGIRYTEDSAVVSGTYYCYRVQAVNEFGASVWSNSSPYPKEPMAPTGLQVTWSSNPYYLEYYKPYWVDNADNETGFEVYRSNTLCSAATTWTKIGTTGSVSGVGGTGEYFDRNVQSGTNYCYRVIAYNSDGYSAWSNMASP